MKLTAADLDLIRAAFPRDAKGEAICVLDGAPRGDDHALCRSHWLGLPSFVRAEYLRSSLVERAKFLLEMRGEGGSRAAP